MAFDGRSGDTGRLTETIPNQAAARLLVQPTHYTEKEGGPWLRWPAGPRTTDELARAVLGGNVVGEPQRPALFDGFLVHAFSFGDPFPDPGGPGSNIPPAARWDALNGWTSGPLWLGEKYPRALPGQWSVPGSPTQYTELYIRPEIHLHATPTCPACNGTAEARETGTAYACEACHGTGVATITVKLEGLPPR